MAEEADEGLVTIRIEVLEILGLDGIPGLEQLPGGEEAACGPCSALTVSGEVVYVAPGLLTQNPVRIAQLPAGTALAVAVLPASAPGSAVPSPPALTTQPLPLGAARLSGNVTRLPEGGQGLAWESWVALAPCGGAAAGGGGGGPPRARVSVLLEDQGPPPRDDQPDPPSQPAAAAEAQPCEPPPDAAGGLPAAGLPAVHGQHVLSGLTSEESSPVRPQGLTPTESSPASTARARDRLRSTQSFRLGAAEDGAAGAGSPGGLAQAAVDPPSQADQEDAALADRSQCLAERFPTTPALEARPLEAGAGGCPLAGGPTTPPARPRDPSLERFEERRQMFERPVRNSPPSADVVSSRDHAASCRDQAGDQRIAVLEAENARLTAELQQSSAELQQSRREVESLRRRHEEDRRRVQENLRELEVEVRGGWASRVAELEAEVAHLRSSFAASAAAPLHGADRAAPPCLPQRSASTASLGQPGASAPCPTMIPQAAMAWPELGDSTPGSVVIDGPLMSPAHLRRNDSQAAQRLAAPQPLQVGCGGWPMDGMQLQAPAAVRNVVGNPRVAGPGPLAGRAVQQAGLLPPPGLRVPNLGVHGFGPLPGSGPVLPAAAFGQPPLAPPAASQSARLPRASHPGAWQAKVPDLSTPGLGPASSGEASRPPSPPKSPSMKAAGLQGRLRGSPPQGGASQGAVHQPVSGVGAVPTAGGFKEASSRQHHDRTQVPELDPGSPLVAASGTPWRRDSESHKSRSRSVPTGLRAEDAVVRRQEEPSINGFFEAFGGFYKQLVHGSKCTGAGGADVLAAGERAWEIDLSHEFPPERRPAQVAAGPPLSTGREWASKG